MIASLQDKRKWNQQCFHRFRINRLRQQSNGWQKSCVYVLCQDGYCLQTCQSNKLHTTRPLETAVSTPAYVLDMAAVMPSTAYLFHSWLDSLHNISCYSRDVQDIRIATISFQPTKKQCCFKVRSLAVPSVWTLLPSLVVNCGCWATNEWTWPCY